MNNAAKLIVVLLSLGWKSLAGEAADSATFDLVRDYSTNSNPNGVWSYGWKSTLAGPFTLFARHGFEANEPSVATFDYWLKPSGGAAALYHNPTPTTVMRNGQGAFPPGAVWIGPGHDGAPDNFCIIRLRIPSEGGGVYELHSSVHALTEGMTGAASGDCDFHVVRNGSEFFGAQIASGAGTNFSQKLSLSAGDAIDFALGRGADGREYASARRIEAALKRGGFLTMPPTRDWLSWIPWLLAVLFLVLFLIAIGGIVTVVAYRRRNPPGGSGPVLL